MNLKDFVKRYSLNGRLLLYALGVTFAIALDPITPWGAADWLIEILLACVASFLGDALEMLLIAGLGTLCILVGLWTSDRDVTPIWWAVGNRLGGICVIWVVMLLGRSRRAAEKAVKTLQGLIPICSSCKRIRYGDDQWQRFEAYITAHSEAKFTHSLCPECFAKYHAQI